jgi:hyperosmotically inducible protein
MKHNLMTLAFLSAALGPMAASLPAQNDIPQPSNPAEARIQKEVRHELAMLPYITVFDSLAYQVNGGTVTLMGEVTQPVDKSDAENAVKNIEGVQQVINKIDVLPPAPMDEQLRVALYRSIYGYPMLEKYAMGVQRPIRIIVKGGHVTLVGVVDNETDRNVAGVRANAVPGAFSVTNDLQVHPS